jgi:hypothetical protein
MLLNSHYKVFNTICMNFLQFIPLACQIPWMPKSMLSSLLYYLYCLFSSYILWGKGVSCTINVENHFQQDHARKCR